MKKDFILCALLICVVNIVAEDINKNLQFSYSSFYNNELVYSSVSELYFGEEADAHYLFAALKEVAKSISLDLGFMATGYPMGSFYLNEKTVFVDYDTSLIEKMIPYVKPMLPVVTNQGVVSSVTLTESSMRELWASMVLLPIIDFKKVNSLVDSQYPNWVMQMPQLDGYVFGLGISDSMSSIAKNVEQADVNAIIDIINTLSIRVRSEIFSFSMKDLQLNAFFTQQKSKGTLRGGKIIRRYYSAYYNAVFSLAVIRIY